MENKKGKHDLTSEEEKALFSNLEFSYSRSKEEVWDALDDIIGEKTEREQASVPTTEHKAGTKVIAINWRVWSVAASLVLLLSAGLFVRFYSRSVTVAPGEFVSHTLPDGSEIHLNAATSISYEPFWWRFKREVRLEGEAYFVVAKGEKFIVRTKLGSTEVLGTEFNVYARGDDFQVYCEEGRVKVRSDMVIEGTQDSVILTKGQLAIVALNHQSTTLIKQVDAVPESSILSWRVGKFLYDTTPLAKVFEDLERHYGVTLTLNNITIEDEVVTASFSRRINIESALDVICTVNRLIYTKTEEGVYVITRQ